MELIGGLDHDIGWAGDQVVILEHAVDRGLGYKVLTFIGKSNGQFAWAELGLLQRHFDDLVLHLERDAVPHPARRRWPILQRLRATFEIAVIPAVERPPGDTDLVQCALGGQVRLLDDPDDLELFGCGIPHSSPSPSAIMLFSADGFRA